MINGVLSGASQFWGNAILQFSLFGDQPAPHQSKKLIADEKSHLITYTVMPAFTIEVANALKSHGTGDVDQLSDFGLSGSVNLGGPDPDPSDRNLMNIITTNETIDVNFSWTQTGIIWRLLDSDLKWECRVFLEKMGPGDGRPVGAELVDFNRGATGGPFVVNYSNSITLRGLREGLYMISATLMLKGPSGEPTRIAAFADLGKLQVYNATTP